MEPYHYICPAALLLFCSGAVIMDVYGWRVSNFWTYGWCAAGFLYECILLGGDGVLDRILGMATPVLLLGWLFYLRMMGAGDVKLFAAAGAWLGSEDILKCLLFSFAAGAVVAAFILLKNGLVKKRFGVLGRYAARLMRTKTRSAYGVRNAKKARVHVSVYLFIGVLLKIIGVY